MRRSSIDTSVSETREKNSINYRRMKLENRTLRRIFGPKREGNGEWRMFYLVVCTVHLI